MANQTEEKKKDPRPLVCGILFGFAGLCLVAVIIITIMFPDSFKAGNTVNVPTAPTSVQIQYERIDLQDMLDDLDENALRAEERYQGKYIEITGEIKSFDSDGKYISIVPHDAPVGIFDSVMCYLTDPTHRTFLLEKNVGDVVTIKGKVSSIGEVLGYSVKIAEISD